MRVARWQQPLRYGLLALAVFFLAAFLAPTDLIKVRGKVLHGLIGSYAYGLCTCGTGGSNYYLGTGGQNVGDPVDVASGAYQIEENVGGLPGRVPATVSWQFQSQNASVGPLGVGTTLSTFYMLQHWVSDPNRWDLVTPSHRHFVFDSTATPGGYYVDSADPELLGAKLYFNPTPTNTNWATIQFKSGMKYIFQAWGALGEVRDQFGHGYTITWSEPGYPMSIDQGPFNRSIQFEYYPTSYQLMGGDHQLLKSISIPGKGSWQFAYDSSFRLFRVTDPLGHQTQYFWTNYTRPDNVTLPLVAQVVDRSGNTRIQNYYDISGRVIQQKFADGGQLYMAYSAPVGQPGTTTVTDPRNNVTTYNFTWNTGGPGYGLNSVTDALGRTTTFTRGGATHLITAVTDFQNRTATFNWDVARGNLLGITLPSASGGTVSSSVTYDAAWSVPVSVTDIIGRTSTATVNPATGLVTSATDPLNHTTTYGYNSDGDLTSVTNARNETTTFTYTPDNLGDLQTAKDPLNHQVTLAYDSVSRPITLTDANGKQITLAYNGMDQVTSWSQLVNGTARQTTIDYDVEGRPWILTNRTGGQTVWTYDTMDRVIAVQNPLHQSVQFTWDKNGNILSKTDRLGQRAEFTYGVGDQRTGITYRRANGTVESTVTYQYDANTHLPTGILDSQGGNVSWTYDALDRMVSESGPNGAVSWTLDEAGRRTSLTVPGQGLITYGYGDNVHLTSVTQNGATATFGYDVLDRMTQRSLPNGVTTVANFDAAGFLSTLVSSRAGTAFDSHAYLHDAAGNITQETANGGTTNYGYDDLYRLTSANGPGGTYAWSYDLRGNRLSQTTNGSLTSYTYDAADRLTGVNGVPVTLDANGNTVAYGNDQYGWDVRGRMTSLTRPGLSASFGYDVTDRRSSKTINGVTTAYLYDGANVVSESSGGTTVPTLHSGGVDAPLARGGEFYTPNAQGSTTTLTDGSGTVTQQYAYSPFGETSGSGSSSNPAQYTGRENDGTGLYYYRARYYAPSFGRFMSEDQLGFLGGPNMFSYVDNNPLNGIDPSGNDQWVAGPFHFGSGPVTMEFTTEGLSKGLSTGVAATGHALSFGLYNGGAYRCEPGFGVSAGLATVGRECLVQAATMGAGEAIAAARAAKAARALEEGREAAAGGAALGCPPGCFTAGTLIPTEDGEKPIEQVHTGDRVLSADPGTGKQSYQTVTRTFVHPATQVLDVETEDGKMVEATPGHPFWVEGKGFTEARLLKRGDEVRRAGGQDVAVLSVTAKSGRFTVYNFEVANTHTYYAGGVWVHNTCPFDIQFSQSSIGNTISQGPRAGESLADLIEEGRELGHLPEGLQLNVMEVNDGLVTLNNRTLYVAQKAGLGNVPVNDVGPSGWNHLNRLLTGSDLAGPLPLGEQPIVR